MIEAFVGLVGGGKTYSSTRRMCEYVLRGGVVCTNILFRGYDPETCTFASDSPFLQYLLSRGWQYQQGQYIYISFEDMCESSDWFLRVPGGVDRAHRTLLCIDESTDLFDTLDRNKLSTNSAYRELFRFLRLSRHAHIDVLFICQDYFSINSRLRGLCGSIWKSTDMQNFRLPTFHIRLPINCFMLQRFDRTGKLELFREFIAKEDAIFGIYESEAFHDSLGISFSGVVGNGRVNVRRKMSTFQRIILWCAFLVSICAFFQLHSLSRALSVLDKKISTSDIKSSQLHSSTKSVPESNNEPLEIKDTFVRGDYEYRYYGNRPVLYFDGCLIEVGMITEYGKCLSITRSSSLCVDGLQRTFLLPRRAAPGGPPQTTACVPPGDGASRL